MRLLFIILAAVLPLAAASGFRAAAAEVDITPKTPQWLMGYAARQSTGVLDPIHIKVAAMEANGTQVYLAASDLTLFSPAVYDEVAEQLERTMGIPRINFWWGVTHTHAAPEVGAPGMYKELLGSHVIGRRAHGTRRCFEDVIAEQHAKLRKVPRLGIRLARIDRSEIARCAVEVKHRRFDLLLYIRRRGPGAIAVWTSEKIILTPRKEGLGWPEELSRYAASESVPMIKLPIRFLRINDTLIWSAPVEMFCEMAMAVRNASPFLHTFYFGYTNGWFGYLPTAQAFGEGGYEPKTSPFTAQAENDVTHGVIAFIQGLR